MTLRDNERRFAEAVLGPVTSSIESYYHWNMTEEEFT